MYRELHGKYVADPVAAARYVCSVACNSSGSGSDGYQLQTEGLGCSKHDGQKYAIVDDGGMKMCRSSKADVEVLVWWVVGPSASKPAGTRRHLTLCDAAAQSLHFA